MKGKFLNVILVGLLVLAVCCGCTADFSYPYEEAEITDISFVYIEEDGTVTTVKSLSRDEITRFLQDFSELELHAYWNDPIQTICGNNIMITFQNEDYHLINRLSTAYYSDGERRFRPYYYDDEFKNLWEEYSGTDYE